MEPAPGQLTGEERQALPAVLERKECRARQRRHQPWLLLAMALAGRLLLGAVCFWLGSAGAGSPFWTDLTAALAGAGGILARMCCRTSGPGWGQGEDRLLGSGRAGLQ